MPDLLPPSETLARFIYEALAEPRERAYAERLGAPDWTYTSATGMLGRATAIARALRDAGVAPGDRVALIANNRVDWIATDFGILFAGAVVVPVFATLALDQMEYIFKDSEAKLAFVETAADAERIRAACPSAPRIVTFDGDGPGALASFATSSDAAYVPDAATDPDDLAVLIYTSGTTGDPKGVMLSHRNLISNARAASELLPQTLKDGESAVLSVLPFAHIYEHTTILIFALNRAHVHVTTPDYLLEDLRSVRPRVMNLVPRIFERVLAGIVGRAKADGGLKAKLVPWALGVGREHAAATQNGGKPAPMLGLQYAIAQKLVLSKIRPQIGLDRLEYFTSGSAPLHRDIMLTFAGMGIPIAEGYGLTETSPVVTGNPIDAIRYGTVGKPISGVEIKLAPDGEILVRGPNVMKGYYRSPGERTFTTDGWFLTGDVGEIDADGYLSITDRKKELIKTSAGKYVAPGRVESALKRSIYLGQCFVIGDGRPYPVALVSPNWELVRRELELPAAATTGDLSHRSDVREIVKREIDEKSADLASFEAIRRFAILPRDLTIEDGELSPTLKVKRRVVEKKFATLIESAYASPKEVRA
jgi:long-chain acyl-CoA synthetase